MKSLFDVSAPFIYVYFSNKYELNLLLIFLICFRLHYCPAEESPDVLNSNSLTLQVEDLVDDHVTNVCLIFSLYVFIEICL